VTVAVTQAHAYARARSLREQFDAAPLVPPSGVRAFGPTVVVAPHPDDEVLGCGGTIALLRAYGVPVHVVIASDGAASHPRSQRFPASLMRELRKAETLEGLAAVGVDFAAVTFLNLPDGAVPEPGTPGAHAATELAVAALVRVPDMTTVLLPWRRDPHDDHRATWALFTVALDARGSPVRRIEYPIWLLVHPGPDDLPQPHEGRLWRRDIAPVLDGKRAAVLAHRSQTTDMIEDDPTGYCLPPAVLEQFFQPWEPFIETQAGGTNGRLLPGVDAW
jgi:LmbE family N-acetylglucosaminyl deacetylase